ncbi:MAG: translation elongation factor 4 [Candidatus Yanofskybacteria bacterium]|nr:translation elongation factor 4 [Candidatus Yanofskybacteria bacterium]
MDIRNFCIIAHIDHGKSTLADRFLELTKTVEQRKMQEQYLDRMDLERERGITIQMQPVRMKMASGTVLNMVDTPGHVDFSYEVSRSLAAVEGALLLVDATKGVQAQTLAHLNIAKKLKLAILPVVNKIDSPLARVDETVASLEDLLLMPREDMFFISAKQGTNVDKVLNSLEARIPAPQGDAQKPLKALVFGSTYDAFKGIIAYIRIYDGTLKAGTKIHLLGTGASGEAKEVGYFFPQMQASSELSAGEIGYVATGLKDSEAIRTGDTLTVVPLAGTQPQVAALSGFQIPKPVVFISLYPEDANDFDLLKTALGKLRLNDPALSYEVEAKEALGRGFRCGFLGILHSEIIAERIRREFDLDIIISRPSVEFRVLEYSGKGTIVRTPSDLPDPARIMETKEPWAIVEVITPLEFLSPVMQVLEQAEGVQKDMKTIGDTTLLFYETPLRGVIADLYDKLKSVSKGMASMDYEVADWKLADVVKLEILIAGRAEETLGAIVPREKAFAEGKAIAEKLKEHMPPQMFDVAIQAVVGGKVLARETIRARRRDVTAPLYGGDVTRKRKLLDRQKKGKKELKEKGQGRIVIPPSVLLKVFRSS